MLCFFGFELDFRARGTFGPPWWRRRTWRGLALEARSMLVVQGRCFLYEAVVGNWWVDLMDINGRRGEVSVTRITMRYLSIGNLVRRTSVDTYTP